MKKLTRLLLSKSDILVRESENQQIMKQEKYWRINVSQRVEPGLGDRACTWQCWTRCLQQVSWCTARSYLQASTHIFQLWEGNSVASGLNLQPFPENCTWLVGDAREAANDWLIDSMVQKPGSLPQGSPPMSNDLCARSFPHYNP